mmetsp:Transcript_15070/g.47497  ORF Transcript_15070/g.47497 Transcript_15070/m.47497 type:complete len:334 (-) Transcript_15070:174-1175(-)
MSNTLCRLPNLCVSVKDVSAPPARRTKRPSLMISGRPSLLATASFTSLMVAALDTRTCTASSSFTASRTVTSISWAWSAWPASPGSWAAPSSATSVSSAPCASPGTSRRPRAKLSCRPSASNSACPLKAPSACIICQTPLWLPSKPCSGSTAPCTVRKSLWRSVLNCLEPLGCVACSSRSFSWKSSLEKPRRRSRCKLKACSSVRLGWPPACFASGSICAAEPAGASGAGSRLSTPMSSRLLRLPSFSASVKEVNAPASPALLTSRPLAMMSGRPSLPATAAFTSPMLAVPGTMTCTSPSALRACLTFTSTSGVASSPRLAVLSASAIAASGG